MRTGVVAGIRSNHAKAILILAFGKPMNSLGYEAIQQSDFEGTEIAI